MICTSHWKCIHRVLLIPTQYRAESKWRSKRSLLHSSKRHSVLKRQQGFALHCELLLKRSALFTSLHHSFCMSYHGYYPSFLDTVAVLFQYLIQDSLQQWKYFPIKIKIFSLTIAPYLWNTLTSTKPVSLPIMLMRLPECCTSRSSPEILPQCWWITKRFETAEW